MHIRSDLGSEFRSDTFKKYGENSIRFSTTAPKHQEQSGLVERHRGTITKMANTLLLHATPYLLLSGSKPTVKHFRIFGCLAVFKKYEFSDKSKRT